MKAADAFQAERDLWAICSRLRAAGATETLLDTVRRAAVACGQAGEDAALERAPVASKGEVAA